MKRSGQSGNQAAKPHVMQLAEQHGIVAVRRQVAPISHPVLAAIVAQLGPEFGGTARLFEEGGVGVTLIGFTRYDQRHRARGPRTADVVRNVPSTQQALQVRLGALGIYGSGHKHKLALAIVSNELDEEIGELERVFEEMGVPTQKRPKCNRWRATPSL